MSEKLGRFDILTKYIEKLTGIEKFGEWAGGEGKGTVEDPKQWPYINYNTLVEDFVVDFYQFSDSQPDFQLNRYGEILEMNDLKWDDISMRNADVESLDEKCILALIMGAIRAERFSNGALLSFFEDGLILKWLIRLNIIGNEA